MIRLVAAAAALLAVYLLALASLDPWDAALGAAVAVAVLVGFRDYLGLRGGRGGGGLAARVVAFVPFALVVVRDVVVGTWSVAGVVLHLRPLEQPGIVAVPFGARTRRGIVVSSFVATLSPGEFLVDLDEERGLMLMHVLDASDPEAVRRRLDAFYERWQRPVFP